MGRLSSPVFLNPASFQEISCSFSQPQKVSLSPDMEWPLLQELMQCSVKGKDTGVFVLGGTWPSTSVLSLSLPGGIKTGPLPAQLYIATMNALLILALVGAAGEFYTLPWAIHLILEALWSIITVCLLSYCTLIFALPWPEPLFAFLGPQYASPFSFSLILFPPSPWDEVREAGKVSRVHEMKQEHHILTPTALG